MVLNLLVAAILGFLTGLGIGGGSLLILWLTFVLKMDSIMARGIVLLFFIPAAVISSFFRWRQGSLSFSSALPAMISGCAAAILFSFLSTMVDPHVLDKAFGLILIAAGVRELLYNKNKKKRQE